MENIKILAEDQTHYIIALMKERFPTPIAVLKKDLASFLSDYTERCKLDQSFIDENPMCPAYHERCLKRLKNELE